MTESFHQMLLAQLPRLRAYAMMLTRNTADTDDLLQTVAVHALRSEQQFQVGSNFRAWTYRIMKNCHISRGRKNRRSVASIDDVPEELLAYSAHIEEHVFSSEIIRAMDKLSPHLREILTLVCGAEVSYEEAATILSCSVGTVKSRLWRARDKMRALLGEAYQNATEVDANAAQPCLPPTITVQTENVRLSPEVPKPNLAVVHPLKTSTHQEPSVVPAKVKSGWLAAAPVIATTALACLPAYA